MDKPSQFFILVDCTGSVCIRVFFFGENLINDRYYIGSVESINTNTYNTYIPEEEIFLNIGFCQVCG
jgi:hypothetical protein